MDIDLVAVRLAEAAEAVEGIRSSLPYAPDDATPPTFYVGEIDQDYDRTFATPLASGLVDAQFTCRVLVAHTDARSNQALLRTFMRARGATSVKAALEAARGAPGEYALGGAAHDLHVRRMQGHRVYRVGNDVFYGAEWIVRVIGTDEG